MIVWADGFDHYGDTPSGGRTAVLSGAWAQIEAGNGDLPSISSDQVRSGDYSLYMGYWFVQTGSPRVRRVFGASQIVVGVATGLYLIGLPNVNKAVGFEFRNNLNECIALFTVESDGSIGLYTGSGRLIAASSDPVIGASAWNHLEAKLTIDDVVGSAEFRVNGVSVINMTDINLGVVGSTQVVFGVPAGAPPGFGNNGWYWDDMVAWNDVGDVNNDFVGQQRVITIFPSSDETPQDWEIVGAAYGYLAINQVPPDGDTTFIRASEVDETSTFSFTSLPPETARIAGVYVPAYAKLEDAGAGSLQVSMQSGAEEAEGQEIPLTTAYTYWGTVFETNPETGLAWTVEELVAATISVKKAA